MCRPVLRHAVGFLEIEGNRVQIMSFLISVHPDREREEEQGILITVAAAVVVLIFEVRNLLEITGYQSLKTDLNCTRDFTGRHVKIPKQVPPGCNDVVRPWRPSRRPCPLPVPL
ncbi:hypothetical protein BHE74_00057565 [Ensete ventricosum]|nr:hypothetical protein BHE74_00057565 [Ensete ventricosum]